MVDVCQQDVFQQYRIVREAIGFIDRSDTGKIAVSGADRFSWLQGMVSNDVKQMASGAATGPMQAVVLDATGHILSDLSLCIARASQLDLASEFGLLEFILIDLPTVNVAKILDLFDRYIITEDVAVQNLTPSLGCFSLQGLDATEGWLEGFLAMHGLAEHTVSTRADHTGSGGVDLYFPSRMAGAIRAWILGLDVPEISAEVQEILRVEAGIPKYGVDMDATTLAPEANLTSSHISLTKGCYVGQEVIARIHSRGHTNRALTGLRFEAADLPCSGDRILASVDSESDSRDVGWITSVAPTSPATNGCPIALGYVRHEYREAGVTLQVGQCGQHGVVHELPFYRKLTE